MQTVSKILFFTGIALAMYATFSRFYGELSIALKTFRSVNLLIAANTLLLASIASNEFFRKR